MGTNLVARANQMVLVAASYTSAITNLKSVLLTK